MQYYRFRGRPDEPRNLKAQADTKALSDLISVNQLHSKTDIRKSQAKKTLAQYVKVERQPQTPSWTVIKPKKEDVTKRAPIVQQKPLASRPSKNVVSKVSERIFNTEVEEKGCGDKVSESKQLLMDLLMETNDEVDQATSQIATIQKLLETVKPNVEQPKKPPNPKVLKKKQLVSSLSDVDRRIQRLQDKYLAGTRPKYKSLNDYKNLSKQIKASYSEKFDVVNDLSVDELYVSKSEVGTDTYNENMMLFPGLDQSIFKSDFLRKTLNLSSPDLDFKSTLADRSNKTVRFVTPRHQKDDLRDKVRMQFENSLFELDFK